MTSRTQISLLCTLFHSFVSAKSIKPNLLPTLTLLYCLLLIFLSLLSLSFLYKINYYHHLNISRCEFFLCPFCLLPGSQSSLFLAHFHSGSSFFVCVHLHRNCLLFLSWSKYCSFLEHSATQLSTYVFFNRHLNVLEFSQYKQTLNLN